MLQCVIVVFLVLLLFIYFSKPPKVKDDNIPNISNFSKESFSRTRLNLYGRTDYDLLDDWKEKEKELFKGVFFQKTSTPKIKGKFEHHQEVYELDNLDELEYDGEIKLKDWKPKSQQIQNFGATDQELPPVIWYAPFFSSGNFKQIWTSTGRLPNEFFFKRFALKGAKPVWANFDVSFQTKISVIRGNFSYFRSLKILRNAIFIA